MKLRMNFVAAWLAFALVATSPTAWGQVTTATLYGTVKDKSGAIIQGATILVVNELTGARLTAHSEAEGQFTVVFLPVGRYTVEVSMSGFKKFQQPGLQLSAAQKAVLEIVLEVGEVSDTVTVTSENPIVQTATASLNESVTRNQVAELPQARRNFTNLINLQPGAKTINTGSSAGLTQFNGLAAGGSTITVDGTDAAGNTEVSSTSMYLNFNFINVVSQEAIEEVQTSKGIMSAEVARTFAGNVNLITRGGTNQFHGAVFENFQNDVLNARNAFLAPTTKKPIVRYNQFGGSAGGPIIKDKLFFFGVYEGYRQRQFAIVTGNVATKEFRDQAIAAVPAYKMFFDQYPLPTDPYAPGAVAALFSGSGSNTASDNHVVARIDYNFNDSNRLSGRYTRGRPNQVIPRVSSDNFREFLGKSEVVTLNFTHTTSSWSSETRFGYNFVHMFRNDQIYTDGKIPDLAVAGAFAGDGGEGLELKGHTWSLGEVFAKTVGRHSIKAGGLFERLAPGRSNEEVPYLSYASTNDFLLNVPNNVTVTFGVAPFQGRSWEMGYFLQDDFRISSSLILNLGVRYEYFSVYNERDGRFFNPDGLAGAYSNPVRLRPADSAYDADRNNFLPRVGFAWNLDKNGKNVVRGGYGIFVAPFPIEPFQANVATSLDIPFRSVFSKAEAAALGLKYPVHNDEVEKLISGTPFPRSFPLFDPNSPNPYNQQWTLDYQRELTPSFVLQTGYVGNHALKVTLFNYFNQPDRLTGARPFPQAQQFLYEDASDSSYYHAWQSSLRKRFSSDFSFDVHYTWSKVIAYGGGDFYSSGIIPQDVTNYRADKGPAAFNVTHRFVSDYVYRLPVDRWLNLKGASRQVLGGWQVAGILSLSSGGSFSATQSGSTIGQRGDYVDGDPYLDNGTRQFLNKSAFASVPVSPVSGLAIRPGNVGKNALYGPGSLNLDFSLAKNFSITEHTRFQIRAEMFNALNHVNLNNPVADVRNVNFGRITGSAAARVIQLNARLSF